MKAIFTTVRSGRFEQRELTPAPPHTVYQSMRALREYLETLAERCWGPERPPVAGEGWSIRQQPRGYLIPLYACHRQGDTITIE